MADWKAARSTKVKQMLLKQQGLKIRIYAILTDVFPCNMSNFLQIPGDKTCIFQTFYLTSPVRINSLQYLVSALRCC